MTSQVLPATQYILYTNDAVQVFYVDGSCLQLSPCGSVFLHSDAPEPGHHPLHGNIYAVLIGIPYRILTGSHSFRPLRRLVELKIPVLQFFLVASFLVSLLHYIVLNIIAISLVSH